MGHIELREIVHASQIPKHQREGFAIDAEVFAIDLNADRSEVALIENTIHETANQAGFSDAELAHHADFLLQHRAPTPLKIPVAHALLRAVFALLRTPVATEPKAFTRARTRNAGVRAPRASSSPLDRK